MSCVVARSPLIALVCLLALPAVALPETVAVLPLRPLGVRADAALALEQTFRAEVARIPDVKLADAAALAKALRAQPDCVASLSCAAGAAQAAGASQLVVGTVSELGELFMLDVKLVDAKTGKEVRRISHPVSGKKDQLLEAVREVAVELVAPDRYAGSLLVETMAGSSKVAGADLYVDGKLAGRTPLTRPIGQLRPGQHALRVSLPGVKDRDLFVDVQFDRVTVARIDVVQGALVGLAVVIADPTRDLPAEGPKQPAAAPPRSAPIASTGIIESRPVARSPALRIVGYCGLGLGLVAAVAGVVFHAQSYATAADLNRREEEGRLSTKDLSLYGDIDSEVKRARALYGVGATLAVGGLAALLYDRYLDSRQPSAGSLPTAPSAAWRASPAVQSGGPAVTFSRRF